MTAYCARHVDRYERLQSVSIPLCGQGPLSRFSRTSTFSFSLIVMPTGKGRVLREALSSTSHTVTDTGRRGGSRTQTSDEYESIKLTVAVVGTIATISGSTAYGVHHLDQTLGNDGNRAHRGRAEVGSRSPSMRSIPVVA